MNKNELLSVMLQQKNAATEIHEALGDRYTLSYETYRGEFPPKINENDIAASRVMWESFESVYPSLLALFTNSQKAPVTFDSDRMTNGKLAEAVTRAIHGTVLKIDGYYRLMMEALKEILITGNQAARVGYEEKTYDTDVVSFDAAPLLEVMAYVDALMKSGYTIDHDLEFDDDNQTATGSVYGERKYKLPVINLIDFRNFYLHPKAVDIVSSPYVGYSEDLTVAEALEMGLPESKLKNAGKDTLNKPAGESKQLLVVNDMDGNIDAPDADYSDYNRTITIYHHYWRGCYKGKRVKLWYVISTDTDILSVEDVKYCPLVLGGMSVVQGSGWSESLYDMTVTAQVNKTRAMRAIQASADGAAYGEYVYVPQNLEPEGLAVFENDRGPGAGYAARSINNAVTKLGGNDVPNAMQLLNQEINEDAQATIQGSAGQAQALEENSNASGTAIQLTQNKQELNENQIAATIAETFIKPIYRIMLLVMQEMGESMEFGDKRIPFKAFHADMGLSISIESPYDRTRAAANAKAAYEQAAQLGTLPQNFQPENVYNIYANYYRAITGQEDVSSLITPPDQMPQPSPLEQAITKFMTVYKLREQIAALGLAEAKVKDMQADTAKKLDDGLLSLAKIAQIKNEDRVSLIDTMLKAKELEQDAANETTQNAQNQERIDQQQG